MWNKDEFKSNFTHASGIALAWVAGRYHLSTDQVAMLSSDVGYIGMVVAFGYGMFAHWGMKKVPFNSQAVQGLPTAPVGASIPLAPLSGAAKVVGALLIGFMVLSYAVPAFAQTTVVRKTTATVAPTSSKPTLAQIIANPLLLFQQITPTLTSDLQNALSLAQAQNPPDQDSIACYTFILKVVTQISPNSNTPSGNGVFTAIQDGRDAAAQLSNLSAANGPLAGLNSACAAWSMDNQATLALIAAKLGVAGGVLGSKLAIGGITLP
jgi:hypothetical protein